MGKLLGAHPVCAALVPLRARHFCAKQMSSRATESVPHLPPVTAGLSCFPAPRIEGGEAVPGAGRDSPGLLDPCREPRRALSLPGKASPRCQGR